MIVANEKESTATKIESPEVNAAAIKALIGPEQGWSDHVLRVIELGDQGYSPAHAHPWPHINYMLEGEGVLVMEGKEHPVKAGSYAFVPAGTHHQFRNTGTETFRFICIVPKEGHQ